MSRNRLDDLPESDLPHAAAAEETGFWGRQGAGCLVIARSTERLLIGLRSHEVMEPGTWGTFGGAIDEGLTPEQAARLELQQETGIDAIELHPLSVYEAPGGTFRYFNFLAVVEEEVEAVLNWENSRAEWFEAGELPRPLHFGLESLFADHGLADRIATALGRSSPRP